MHVLVRVANAGTTSMQGLDITIENYAGEFRHGKDWVQKMAHDYGYINNTVGADGDEVDCFLGPNPDSNTIYIIEQVRPARGPGAYQFDEHKVMLGFSNIAEAKDAYHANYPEGWKGFGNIKEILANDFWNHFNLTEKEVENAARGDREEEMEGWHEGLAGHQNIVVTKKQKDKRKKLVRDEDLGSDKKENDMQTIVENKKFKITTEDGDTVTVEGRDENAAAITYGRTHGGKGSKIKDMVEIKENSHGYKFDSVTAADKISKGQHTYGSKVDNSVCECPTCYGGGRLGMFACKNCKGTGKVANEKKKEAGTCATCDGTGKVKGKKCKECDGTGFEMSS